MRRFLVFLVAICGVVLPVVGQQSKVQNMPYIDQRTLHFGFALGTHTQDLSFVHSGVVTDDGETWYGEVSSFSPGFNVSLLADLYLNPYMSLRFAPGIYFGNKVVTFRESGSGEVEKSDIKSNYIIAPLELKLATPRVNNYKPYVMVGMGGMFDVSKRGDLLLRTNTADLFWEVGLGCDLYLYYFKLIPELKFMFGITDAVDRTRDDLTDPLDIKYTNAISRATTGMVVLSFYFE